MKNLIPSDSIKYCGKWITVERVAFAIEQEQREREKADRREKEREAVERYKEQMAAARRANAEATRVPIYIFLDIYVRRENFI